MSARYAVRFRYLRPGTAGAIVAGNAAPSTVPLTGGMVMCRAVAKGETVQAPHGPAIVTECKPLREDPRHPDRQAELDL